MSQIIKGFDADGEFFDDENFPKGFSKSGEFTLAEARLLEDYGNQLEALSSGQLTASTAEQKQLLKVLAGDAEPASTLEKAWLKYTRKIDEGLVAISAFGSSVIDVDDDEDIQEPIDDLED